MEITSFWGTTVTETSPAVLIVPDDGVFTLNQGQKVDEGACANTTSVWVKSTFVADNLDDSDESDEKESIEESDSDDETTTHTLAIGHLTWGRQEHLRTELTFGAGEKVRFTVEGDGEVHLAGKIVVESLAFEDEDDEDEDDEMHAVIEGESDSDDEDYSSVDSDEGETLYELSPGVVVEEVTDSADDDEDGMDMDSDELEDQVSEDDDEDDEGMRILELASSDSDDEMSESAKRSKAREIRRMLLGADAGDRPDEDDDDDDDAYDNEALYAALAADNSDDDGELADEAHFIASSRPNKKKRARSGEFDDELASPGHKRSKKHDSHGHKRHHKKHHRKH